MGLPKGRTNNPSGRRKGITTLKKTSATKAFIESFLKRNRRLMQRDWMFMSEYQRVVMTEKFMAYTTPKAAPANEFENLSEEQLDIVLNKLIEQNERNQKQIQTPGISDGKEKANT